MTAPIELLHERCGEHTTPKVTCSCCGETLELEELIAHAGPGGRIGPGTRVVGERLGSSPRRLAG